MGCTSSELEDTKHTDSGSVEDGGRGKLSRAVDDICVCDNDFAACSVGGTRRIRGSEDGLDGFDILEKLRARRGLVVAVFKKVFGDDPVGELLGTAREAAQEGRELSLEVLLRAGDGGGADGGGLGAGGEGHGVRSLVLLV